MKKLSLNRETIRRLDESRLEGVYGGRPAYTEYTAFKCYINLTDFCVTTYVLTNGCICWHPECP